MHTAGEIENLATGSQVADFFLALGFGAVVILVLWFVDLPGIWLVPIVLVWATAHLAGCITSATQIIGGQIHISTEYALKHWSASQGLDELLEDE